MTSIHRARWLVLLAGLCVAMHAAALAAEPAQEGAVAKPDRAAGVKAFLEAVPADAQMVLAVQDLENLDFDLMRLTQAMGLPLGVLPSGMMQTVLGSSDQIDMSAVHGVILLDSLRFKGATSWKWLQGEDSPILVAISAKDPKEFLESIEAQPSEAEGFWTLQLLKQEAFAAVRGKVVLLSPDLKMLQAEMAADRARMPAALVETCAAGDLWMLVGVRQMLVANRSLLRSMCLAGMAGVPGSASEGDMTAGACDGALACLYVDLVAAQMDDLAVSVDIDRQGVCATYLLTYPPGSVLGRAWTAGQPARALLPGLPAGDFLFAGSMGRRLADTVLAAWELVWPMVAMMSGTEGIDNKELLLHDLVPFVFDRQIHQQLEYISVAGYRQPTESRGIGALVGVVGCKDLDKTWQVIRRNGGRWHELHDAKRTDAETQYCDRFRYVEAAEKVGSVDVDRLHIGPKIAAATSEPAASQPSQAQDHTVSILIGEPDCWVRIARKAGRIIGTIEGGTGMLARTLSADAGEKASLASDPRIGKAAAEMPKNRDAEGYLAADALASFVARWVTEEAKLGGRTLPKPWSEPKTDQLMTMGAWGSETFLRADLVMPARDMAILKDLVMWGITSMMQSHTTPIPDQPSEDAEEKTPAEPAPL